MNLENLDINILKFYVEALLDRNAHEISKELPKHQGKGYSCKLNEVDEDFYNFYKRMSQASINTFDGINDIIDMLHLFEEEGLPKEKCAKLMSDYLKNLDALFREGFCRFLLESPSFVYSFTVSFNATFVKRGIDVERSYEIVFESILKSFTRDVLEKIEEKNFLTLDTLLANNIRRYVSKDSKLDLPFTLDVVKEISENEELDLRTIMLNPYQDSAFVDFKYPEDMTNILIASKLLFRKESGLVFDLIRYRTVPTLSDFCKVINKQMYAIVGGNFLNLRTSHSDDEYRTQEGAYKKGEPTGKEKRANGEDILGLVENILEKGIALSEYTEVSKRIIELLKVQADAVSGSTAGTVILTDTKLKDVAFHKDIVLKLLCGYSSLTKLERKVTSLGYNLTDINCNVLEANFDKFNSLVECLQDWNLEITPDDNLIKLKFDFPEDMDLPVTSDIQDMRNNNLMQQFKIDLEIKERLKTRPFDLKGLISTESMEDFKDKIESVEIKAKFSYLNDKIKLVCDFKDCGELDFISELSCIDFTTTEDIITTLNLLVYSDDQKQGIGYLFPLIGLALQEHHKYGTGPNFAKSKYEALVEIDDPYKRCFDFGEYFCSKESFSFGIEICELFLEDVKMSLCNTLDNLEFVNRCNCLLFIEEKLSIIREGFFKVYDIEEFSKNFLKVFEDIDKLQLTDLEDFREAYTGKINFMQKNRDSYKKSLEDVFRYYNSEITPKFIGALKSYFKLTVMEISSTLGIEFVKRDILESSKQSSMLMKQLTVYGDTPQLTAMFDVDFEGLPENVSTIYEQGRFGLLKKKDGDYWYRQNGDSSYTFMNYLGKLITVGNGIKVGVECRYNELFR